MGQPAYHVVDHPNAERRGPFIHDPLRWTTHLPAQEGWYEVCDAQRELNAVVRVFRAGNGELAVANMCPCKPAFYLRMWLLPAFRTTAWRGPVEVANLLPTAEGPCAEPCDTRQCLLGEHEVVA